MKPYRCYFLNDQSHIIGHHVIECRDDEEAVTSAGNLLDERGHYAAELWDGVRRVQFMGRES